MKTALRLANYEDIIDPKDVYSLIALTAYYNQYYAIASRAFIKLESLPSLAPKEREVRQQPFPPCPVGCTPCATAACFFSADDPHVPVVQTYRELALSIFTSLSPVDPGSRSYPCLNKACAGTIHDWYALASPTYCRILWTPPTARPSPLTLFQGENSFVAVVWACSRGVCLVIAFSMCRLRSQHFLAACAAFCHHLSIAP